MHVEAHDLVKTYPIRRSAAERRASREDQVRALHGLSVVQTCEAGAPDELRLTTTLLHASGQWIGGTTAIPLTRSAVAGFSRTSRNRASVSSSIESTSSP